jgi:hypothetical protein
LTKDPNNTQAKKFLESISNDQFEANEAFHMIYRDVILENIEAIK